MNVRQGLPSHLTRLSLLWCVSKY